MRIFQSEQVIKLRNVIVLCKKWIGTEFARSQTIGLSCVGPMPGHYQKYTSKQPNIAELKTALLSIWNDLPQEIIDKAILSFQHRLDFRVLLQPEPGGHFEHSIQFKYRESSWNSSLKHLHCW